MFAHERDSYKLILVIDRNNAPPCQALTLYQMYNTCDVRRDEMFKPLTCNYVLRQTRRS